MDRPLRELTALKLNRAIGATQRAIGAGGSMHTPGHEGAYPFAGVASKLEDLGKIAVMAIILNAGFLISYWIVGELLLSHFWFGMAGGMFTISALIPKFLVSVPEITGLITVNALTGRLSVYGTGLHLRYPWEQVSLGNYINLRQTTESIEETYPSQDALMSVRWVLQYTPTLEGLPRYISADDNSIKEGLRSMGSSVIAEKIGRRPGEKAKRDQEEIEDALLEEFRTEEGRELFDRYGIELDHVEIADLDFDPSVQAARSALAESDITVKIAEKFRIGDVTHAQALNSAQAERGKADKKVIDINNLSEAARAFGEALRGGRP